MTILQRAYLSVALFSGLASFAQSPSPSPANATAAPKSSPSPTPDVIQIYPTIDSVIRPKNKTTTAKPLAGPPPVYALEPDPQPPSKGGMEILSNTKGVDFGPYMKRFHALVEEHWYPLVPEIALPPVMKKGRVVIEFAITKDGTLEGMKIVGSSGDAELDRAAWGALTSSSPVLPLPKEFTGDVLRIRSNFYYNPLASNPKQTLPEPSPSLDKPPVEPK